MTQHPGNQTLHGLHVVAKNVIGKTGYDTNTPWEPADRQRRQWVGSLFSDHLLDSCQFTPSDCAAGVVYEIAFHADFAPDSSKPDKDGSREYQGDAGRRKAKCLSSTS